MDFPPEMTISEAINRAILEAKIEILEVMGCDESVCGKGSTRRVDDYQHITEYNLCLRCTKLAELKGERDE